MVLLLVKALNFPCRCLAFQVSRLYVYVEMAVPGVLSEMADQSHNFGPLNLLTRVVRKGIEIEKQPSK
jgi:hypothetical protein